MPRIYSYVITHDTGFAPNPFGGFCTLATCKPAIRRTAATGDWLVGTGSARAGLSGRVIYAAQISSICSIAEYGANPDYAVKRPVKGGSDEQRSGDNIYFRDANGEWLQRDNDHHAEEHRDRDLRGGNVLIASRFWYFGSAAHALPERLLPIIKTGPGHKITRTVEAVEALEHWLAKLPQGLTAQPNQFKPCGSCS